MSELAVDPEPWNFMFKSDGTAKIPEILDFRRTVSSMSEHKAMFRPTDYLERATAMHFRWEPQLLFFVGSWEVPEWFSSGGGVNSNFVNPNHRGKERYTISGTRCACGNVITDIRQGVPIEENHAEGCTPADRRAVVQRIKDIRLQRIVMAGNMCQPLTEVAPCLDMDPDDGNRMLQQYGLNWLDLKDIGRHRMAKTIDILHDQGYSYREIGEVFGCSKDRIYDYSSRKVFNRRTETVA